MRPEGAKLGAPAATGSDRRGDADPTTPIAEGAIDGEEALRLADAIGSAAWPRRTSPATRIVTAIAGMATTDALRMGRVARIGRSGAGVSGGSSATGVFPLAAAAVGRSA